MSDEICLGCGGTFEAGDGPTHDYMQSAPGCWARFGEVVAREYSHPRLLAVHRLSVDAYAVQHPGSSDDRRAVQSVGLHLARLMLQLVAPTSAQESQRAMLYFAAAKDSLPRLEPPAIFGRTVLDVALDGTLDDHARSVERWAADAWTAWSAHHDFISRWAAAALADRV